MGGGDLNLKKSWHTQTLKNIEDVWKREQAVEERKKLMEQRQKQLKEERAQDDLRQMQEDAGLVQKRAARLDWMYAGTSSGSAAMQEEKEAYLLGRKNVDKLLAADNVSKPSLTVAKQFAGITPENEHRDMQNKIRDDPLYAIKLREKQTVDNVINNPVKVKMLQTQAAAASSKPDGRRESVRSRHDRSRSPSEERRHSRRRERSRSPRRHRRRSSTPTRPRRNSPPSATDRHRHHYSRDNQRDSQPKSSGKSEMTQEERERRLAEMVNSARQLTAERTVRVQHYREQEEREAKEFAESSRHDTARRGHVADIGRMVYGTDAGGGGAGGGSSISQGALHNQLRRKMNSIQRGASSDTGFMRRT